MRKVMLPRQIAAAMRARAIAFSRSELRLFIGLMGVLLALWTVVIFAVGHGGERLTETGPGVSLIACTLPPFSGPPLEGGSNGPAPGAPRLGVRA